MLDEKVLNQKIENLFHEAVTERVAELMEKKGEGWVKQERILLHRLEVFKQSHNVLYDEYLKLNKKYNNATHPKTGYKNWETTVINMKWWDRLVFLFTGDRYFKLED